MAIYCITETNILPYSILKSDGSGEEFKVLHCEHQKNLYCMTIINEEMVLTCGYDRSLVCYKPGKDQLVFNLPTFSSRITCMVQNVQDPSVLALGCGDGQIRIWKSNSHKTMYDYISIWQKMSRCEILALAWHPTRDGLLAFATDEGRIGNVPLFVNLIFIFYPRWRFKLGGFFYKQRSLGS